MKTIVLQAIDRENVGEMSRGFQTNADVVAKNELVSDFDHVTGDAIVFGSDAFGRKQFGRDRAENGSPTFVKLVEAFLKLGTLDVQPILNDLIGAALKLRLAEVWSFSAASIRFDLRFVVSWFFGH